MPTKLSRREAIAGLSSALVVSAFGAPVSATELKQSPYFRHGVASGDPDRESLVIWTRISGLSGAVQVDWQIALDPEFKTVMSRGTVSASAKHDYTVKVLVSSLEAGKTYFYRFHLPDGYSPVGRTRTLPEGNISSLTLAVVSCSNYPFGYFNAYEAIARDPSVEWVLHLGDYFYEYGRDGYGGETGARLGRNHEPAGETVSLSDYRQRHAQYKADSQSQLMHAAHPMLAIWDDHEVTNNPWMGGAQNHQPESEGSWAARQEAALRAYYEWMPIRDPFPGQSRAAYWRHWEFGSLASMVSLETRLSGRAQQIELATYAPALQTREDAQRFLREVVAAPDRPMLSDGMQDFLRKALTSAKDRGRQWQLIANQIPMARTLHPLLDDSDIAALRGNMSKTAYARLEEIARRGQLGLPLYLDPWDGYPVAREEFYALCQQSGARDLVVLTGDSHSFWSNQLFDSAGTAMGVEIGTSGVTSPGAFMEFSDQGAALMDTKLAASNREILWANSTRQGYVRLSMSANSARADYMAVDTILEPSNALTTLRSETLLRKEGSLVYESQI
ncbi:MAG: alkaline phosphatase [Congregibacter sp.]